MPADIQIDDLRVIIQEKGGVPVALQKLSFAGKRLADSNRTLKQFGVAYWHQRFPHWHLKLLSV